jgi:hypothetical protein
MADEAFALSPISARATLPGEADYDAISEAFMETSRGRWFLSEYAKRNRNADTRMVLDAVARIEANLAAEKNTAPENQLAEALAVIRSAVDEARMAASAAIEGLALDESLAPIRKGAQVIRETLLKLREIGADGRIYDLMDSQVRAIETGCESLAATDGKAALSAAFDLLQHRIDAAAGIDTAETSPASEAPESSSAAARAEASSSVTETSEATAWPTAIEVAATLPPEDIVAPAQVEAATADAETALDDALDLIALEMAAPDFAENDADEFCTAEPDPVEPISIAQGADPIIAPRPTLEPSVEPSLEPSLEPSVEPSLEPSLGASLIANGIVRRPDTSAADPLAPIRRMSQAEKIAFFS